MKLKSLITLALTSCLVLNIATAQVQKRTIKFANQNPDGHPIYEGMKKFAEIVKEKSQGKIKVNTFPGGVLGSDQANLSSLQGGTLEMAAMNSSIFASLSKDLAVYDLPFLFDSAREVDVIVDGKIGNDLHKKLEDKGIIGLSYFDNGFRVITNSKRPINKIDDLNGLKLRVIPNPIDVDLINALGGNATPLPVPEIFTALEQKAIDGNTGYSVINLVPFKIYEVQKYLALSHHQYNIQSVVVSKRFWDKLSSEEKDIISKAAIEASKFQRDLARKKEVEFLEDLKKQGMEITSFTQTNKDNFIKKAQPVVDKYIDNIGKETVNSIKLEIENVRNSAK